MEIFKDNKVVLETPMEEPILEIEGGHELRGEVQIPGAKNAALPAIVAACLSSEDVELINIPHQLNDVRLLIELLRESGAEINYCEETKVLTCNGAKWEGGKLDANLSGKIRHSLLLLGLSSKWGKEVFLPLPGGCDLGSRKHDMHVDALRCIGDKVVEDNGIRLIPQNSDGDVIIDFYYPTFGGTLNILFAAVTQYGREIIINNPAKNPEVLDVIELLNSMGAKISRDDSNNITIVGVERLIGTRHFVMPDRIIGATVVAAVGLVNGEVLLKNFQYELLDTELGVWRNSGLTITDTEDGILVKKDNSAIIMPTEIKTKAYPGFHTDIQPLHTILMVLADGKSKVTETILDGRFKYCAELNKLGADITVVNGDFQCVNGATGQIAEIKGVKSLKGTKVKATDIRGGAAVALAGLVAEGSTIITNIYQLERGYASFVEIFNSLGARIRRIN